MLVSVYAQKAPKYQDTIPFRNDLGLIIIPLTFNGEVKEFAFDTGAEVSVAYAWAQSRLKKTNKTTTITSSSGLKSKMRYYKSGTIELGSRKITGHRILNTPENTIFSCYEIDGILGVDIIKEFNWTIDYEHNILIMNPANYYPNTVDTMHELDFDFQYNRPIVFLNRNNSTFKFLLDTGAGGDSNISKRNYKLRNIDDYPQASFQSGSYDINGIFTPSKPAVFRFPIATSGETQLLPLIRYNNAKSSKLGNQLWKDKQLFLSLKDDRLLLSSPEIKQQATTYSCTVSFQKGKMIVVRIQEGSSAWNAEIRQGDEVIQFNSKKFTDFCTLDQYQRQLVSESKPYTLTFVNGKQLTISKTPLFDE